MAWKIELDISRCCACGACAIACMDQNDIDLSTGVRPYRTVFREETRRTGEIRYYSMACMHCDNAPCVTACPSGCLYKDPETGLTLYNTQYCIGCHSCAMACPLGAPPSAPTARCASVTAASTVCVPVWSQPVCGPAPSGHCSW